MLSMSPAIRRRKKRPNPFGSAKEAQWRRREEVIFDALYATLRESSVSLAVVLFGSRALLGVLPTEEVGVCPKMLFRSRTPVMKTVVKTKEVCAVMAELAE